MQSLRQQSATDGHDKHFSLGHCSFLIRFSSGSKPPLIHVISLHQVIVAVHSSSSLPETCLYEYPWAFNFLYFMIILIPIPLKNHNNNLCLSSHQDPLGHNFDRIKGGGGGIG